ncbi:MAG: hypothetical protein QGH39_08415 [Candidatus Thermoplasmatota archaeon]|nr:hypothetical protein [Candidatus Thermoplasmatota archaeon]MDP7265568.1 hypothetical protein [Candidatus Thermoplasmatota archaeon]
MNRRPPYQRKFERPKSKKQPMLNLRKELEFKYDLRKTLEAGKVDPKAVPSFIATLFSKGSRINLFEAKDYINNKFEEGLFDERVRDLLLNLLRRYQRWR